LKLNFNFAEDVSADVVVKNISDPSKPQEIGSLNASRKELTIPLTITGNGSDKFEITVSNVKGGMSGIYELIIASSTLISAVIILSALLLRIYSTPRRAGGARKGEAGRKPPVVEEKPPEDVELG